VDMNSLLSGLASAQNNGNSPNKQCCNNNNGGFGGNSIIWIIVLLFLFVGQGQGHVGGTVCGCKKKHCKELCRCGNNNPVGCGIGGLGSLGGLGSGYGCWWIIILVLLFACGGNQKKGCTNNIINLDNCDEE
jgi:hypothetical protein